MKAKTGKNVVCPVCAKVTYRFPSQIRAGYKDYCSKKCWYSVLSLRLKSDKKYKAGVLKGLRNGGEARKEALRTPESRAKMSAIQKHRYQTGSFKPRYGADNNLWKGGVATLQNTLRQTPEYKDWRKAVYDRDSYTCQHCGTNKDLHAHHIKTFSQYPSLRYDVDNGLTVCRPCHSKIHGRYLPDISKANRRIKVTV